MPLPSALALLPIMSRCTRRFAVFDLGSNSIKFAVFEAGADGALRRVDECREMIALGDEVFPTGRVSEERAQAAEAALASLRRRMGRVDGAAAAATSALRSAENGAETAERFSAALGLPVEILDAEEEARLLARGVLDCACWDGAAEAAILEIGGGSAEIVRARPGAEWEVLSLDLGAIRLRSEHSPPPDSEPYSAQSVASLEAAVASALAGVRPLEPGGRCFGSGGGFSTLGHMLWGARNRPGIVIRRSQIEKLAEALRATSAAEAARRYGLELRRARIMFAGATAARRALERLGAEQVEVSWAGLREGLAARLARGMSH